MRNSEVCCDFSVKSWCSCTWCPVNTWMLRNAYLLFYFMFSVFIFRIHTNVYTYNLPYNPSLTAWSRLLQYIIFDVYIKLTRTNSIVGKDKIHHVVRASTFYISISDSLGLDNVHVQDTILLKSEKWCYK